MPSFTEDELVDTIRKLLSGDAPGVRLGPGDDAALVEPSPHLGVLTADLLIEGVHFDRARMSPKDLGYKALAVNVSDVAAMGGSPRYALVTMGLSPDVEASWVVEVYGGLREAADEHAVAVVGGDVSASDRVVISVTVTGEVPEDGAVTRAGARPSDRLVVTGSLGAAAGGLRLSLADRSTARHAAGTAWERELVRAHVRPVARVGEGRTLAQAGATAMMDVSDGLAIDLWRLCRESEVGAVVRLDAVPVADALGPLAEIMPDLDPLRLALGGGEDYELIAAVPPDAVEPTAAKLGARFGTPLSDIGEFRTEPGVVAIDPDGGTRPLPPHGWDHFGG
ncbi:MAG: thiamine-phosphate kinase [Actinomycetota bacterium]